MLKFIWDTDLETENLLIDSQHREIFNRVNNLISAISIGKGKEETRKILGFLSSYVVYHFEAEENYMKISEYSDLDIHIMEHKQFINEINNIAAKEHLPVKAIKTDIINYQPADKYELAICMGNSFNFFDEADALKLLTTISSCLQAGGYLLINSWSIAEIAYKSFSSSNSSQVGDVQFQNELKFLLHPTRIETESTMTTPDGNSEIKNGIDYIYSLNEMEKMMNAAGLSLKEVYSIPGRKKFTLGEPRAYLVAEKK